MGLVVLGVSAAAFATLGDGNGAAKRDFPKKSLLSNKTIIPGSFSLKSGNVYRGSQVINAEPQVKYIRINTTVTLQKGNTTYIVPLKKKVILQNVKFNIGNRQLKRN